MNLRRGCEKSKHQRYATREALFPTEDDKPVARRRVPTLPAVKVENVRPRVRRTAAATTSAAIVAGNRTAFAATAAAIVASAATAAGTTGQVAIGTAPTAATKPTYAQRSRLARAPVPSDAFSTESARSAVTLRPATTAAAICIAKSVPAALSAEASSISACAPGIVTLCTLTASASDH